MEIAAELVEKLKPMWKNKTKQKMIVMWKWIAIKFPGTK